MAFADSAAAASSDLSSLPDTLPGETAAAREARLRTELDQLNQEIADQQSQLSGKQKESVSIQRDIDILNLKIKQAQLKIKASTVVLQQLGKDIDQKNSTIQTLAGRIQSNQQSLSQLIRRTDQIDQYSLTEMVLLDQSLSKFFADFDSYEMVKSSLRDSYLTIKSNKDDTEAQKQVLMTQKQAETAAKAKIVAQQAEIKQAEADKAKILALNKQQQKDYQKNIASRQARAAEIRAALFNLRDTAAIPFGTAYAYAVTASQKTGVRPAFLLAILTQETNLGKNVGTCNRPQDPPEKSWKVIMKPDRDQGPYLEITSALGLNPDTMPLSCPWKGGWGGAMGPAQFIPSTWQLLAPRVASALGESAPNPWNPRDAFMASSIYLSDLGAGGGGYTSERTAALKYYAGGGWAKKANAFYGDQVMAKATNIQNNMIDLIQGN